MGKEDLKFSEMHKFMENNFTLYTSEWHEGKLLRMWISLNSVFKVTYAGEILYRGANAIKAVNIYRNA